jgi:hypothetical protein
MICPISEQIAIHANEPEQIPVSEIFGELKLDAMHDRNGVLINGELVSLWQITDSIDEEYLRCAAQNSVCDNGLAVYELYIKTLEEFING